MIVIATAQLKRIVDEAEQSFPNESCGLLVGVEEAGTTGRTVRVLDVQASPNLAQEPERRFEVDPALRLRLQRELRGSGTRVVGLYHSHPNGKAQPSAQDLAAAWEPDLAWLITAVRDRQAVLTSAHLLAENDGRLRFVPVALRTDDWEPYVERVGDGGP
ncbi:MAG: M67 family metallopeptidase [Alphaproteobacteria bacterium]|nr:M67 family metallopeptidase [Alphaproteobacteria bacterium]